MPEANEAQANNTALELEVMGQLVSALERLPATESRQRVLQWASGVFGLAAGPQPLHLASPAHGDVGGSSGTLNELLDRAEPGNRQERILTVAYWLQVEQGQAEWTAQAVNDLLKDLGEGVPNITDALAALVSRRPSLVRQIRKTGRTQQARKRYSLTEAGRQCVRDLISGKGN